MKRLLMLLWLHVKSLTHPLTLIVFVILAPLTLGLVSGYGNKMNYDTDVQVAVVDRSQSPESADLIDAMDARGWRLHIVSDDDADRLLKMGDVASVMRIGEAFSAFINGNATEADIELNQTEHSLLQSSIRQSVMLFAESRRSVSLIEQNVRQYHQRQNLPSDHISDEMARLIEHYRANEAALPIHYVNRPDRPLRKTIVVGDFSLEVLYLTVLAVIGATAEKNGRKRLLSLPHGLTVHLVTGYVAWLLPGLIQIVLFTAAMAFAMSQAALFFMVFPLFTYFALMLALAFWLKHLNPEIGLYLGLLFSFVLALLGGVFFPLPGQLLMNVAQYTPAGWIYAYQLGLAALPVWSIWLAAAISLTGALFTLSRPATGRQRRTVV